VAAGESASTSTAVPAGPNASSVRLCTTLFRNVLEYEGFGLGGGGGGSDFVLQPLIANEIIRTHRILMRYFPRPLLMLMAAVPVRFVMADIG